MTSGGKEADSQRTESHPAAFTIPKQRCGAKLCAFLSPDNEFLCGLLVLSHSEITRPPCLLLHREKQSDLKMEKEEEGVEKKSQTGDLRTSHTVSKH